MNRLFSVLLHKPWAKLPSQKKAGLSILPSTRQSLMAALFMLSLGKEARLQEQNLLYSIHRKGEKVGDLSYRKVTEGSKTTFVIQSVVKVSLLLTFTVQAWEESVYQSNVLQFSSLVRKVNGRERTNKQIHNTGNNEVTITNKNNAKQVKNYVITYNTLRLYATEPLLFSHVFSDNYQQFLPIEKLAAQHYRVKFPEGGSNEYFYRDGLCRRVKVSSTLFDAEFVLQNH